MLPAKSMGVGAEDRPQNSFTFLRPLKDLKGPGVAPPRTSSLAAVLPFPLFYAASMVSCSPKMAEADLPSSEYTLEYLFLLSFLPHLSCERLETATRVGSFLLLLASVGSLKPECHLGDITTPFGDPWAMAELQN